PRRLRCRLSSSVLFPLSADPGSLLSFPTRRSSDLVPQMASSGVRGTSRQLLQRLPEPQQQLDVRGVPGDGGPEPARAVRPGRAGDRKSTRLNFSHVKISYAVFCLKKKNKVSL